MAGRPTTKQAPLFGQRLSELRKERGWTQNELAKRLGTTVKMVTYYEREAVNPTSKTVAAIAKVFGLSPADFMGQSDKKANGRKPGPPSQIEQRLSAVRQLPREKQKVVLQLLDSFLQTNGSSS